MGLQKIRPLSPTAAENSKQIYNNATLKPYFIYKILPKYIFVSKCINSNEKHKN